MKKKIFYAAAICLIGAFSSLTSCSDNNDDPDVVKPVNPTTKSQYILGVSTDKKSYFLLTDNIESGKIDMKGNGIESISSNIHSFKNKKGFVLEYRKGDPAGLQIWGLTKDATLKKEKELTLSDREEFIENFNDQVLITTSVTLKDGKRGQAFMLADGETGALAPTKYISTEDLIEKGEYANFAGLVTVGKNFAMAVEPYRIPTKDNNSQLTQYPDRVWLQIFDKDINKVKTIFDDRMSNAVGRRRSGRLSCIGTNASGDIYVFSPANLRRTKIEGDKYKVEASTKHPSSVLRVNKTTLEFDKNYYFDLEKLSGGLKLQNAVALTKDFFLLNFFAKKEEAWNMATANKFALFDVVNGTFKWIEGLPKSEDIGGYVPSPLIDAGKIYLPLTAAGKNIIYKLDPENAKATAGAEIIGDVTVGELIKLNVPQN